MTEQELTNLGFAKVNVSEEESGSNAYYYFDLDLTHYTSLISNSNDEALKNKWQVELFQDDSIVFTDIKDLQLFIEIIKRNTK